MNKFPQFETWGWELILLGIPWVAHRVWPMPNLQESSSSSINVFSRSEIFPFSFFRKTFWLMRFYLREHLLRSKMHFWRFSDAVSLFFFCMKTVMDRWINETFIQKSECIWENPLFVACGKTDSTENTLHNGLIFISPEKVLEFKCEVCQPFFKTVLVLYKT